jgi:hypothetical protein
MACSGTALALASFHWQRFFVSYRKGRTQVEGADRQNADEK